MFYRRLNTILTSFEVMEKTNKYHRILNKILDSGKVQQNKKGSIKYLLDERLHLTPSDLIDIFETHGIARKKLKAELGLFMQGERNIEKIPGSWNNLVGLLRSNLGQQLPDLFRETSAIGSKN